MGKLQTTPKLALLLTCGVWMALAGASAEARDRGRGGDKGGPVVSSKGGSAPTGKLTCVGSGCRRNNNDVRGTTTGTYSDRCVRYTRGCPRPPYGN